MKIGEAIMALKMMNLTGAHPFLHWEEMMEVRDMAISALREQEERRWIPAKDRLPEEKQRVLVRCKTVGTTVGWRLWGEWMTDLGDGGSEVTHWMPLPEPYTAKAEDDDNARRVKPLEFDRFKNDTLKDAQPTTPAHWEKADIPLPYQMRTVPTPSGTFVHREMYVCSACDGYNDKNTQYCPHCGARMDRKDGNG